MRGVDVVRRGPERLRVGPWRGDARIAYVAPVTEGRPPTADMVRWCCTVLAQRGYQEAVTGALAPAEAGGFRDAGFEIRDHLHLLVHDLTAIPDPPPARIRHGRLRDRRPALAVDGKAFEGFWRLDESGLVEALGATPLAWFRVAGPASAPDRPWWKPPIVAGYAVSGLAGRQGYLQRLAVDPEAQGQGIGRALVLDSLRWMSRKKAGRAVVNTQVGNERAVALYRDLGFRLQPSGLEVLTVRLPARDASP